MHLSDPQTLTLIDRAINTFTSDNNNNNTNKNKPHIQFICDALEVIQKIPKEIETRTPLSMESISTFIDTLSENTTPTPQNTVSIFSFLYRLLSEFHFSIFDESPVPGSISYKIYRALSEARYSKHLPNEYKEAMIYPDKYMPIELVKRVINTPNFTAMSEFDARYADLVSKTQEASKVAEEVAELKRTLEGYKTAFNFVGLYDGFDSIAKNKRSSARWSLFFMILLALIMITPLALKGYLIYTKYDFGIEALSRYELIISALGFELLLLYFFRVVLHNYKSIQAQLVQIDLRRTLCQFIQDYAVYAAKIQKNNGSLLERFEQVIFSGIVADEGKIPSTFDGLEQLLGAYDRMKGVKPS